MKSSISGNNPELLQKKLEADRNDVSAFLIK